MLMSFMLTGRLPAPRLMLRRQYYNHTPPLSLGKPCRSAAHLSQLDVFFLVISLRLL
jgi:hypothetical protein